jgi:hypothetical protein
MKPTISLLMLFGLGTFGAHAANLVVNGGLESGLTGSHNYNVSCELGSFHYGPTSYGNLLPDNWNRTGTRGWTVTDDGATDTFPAALGHYAFRLDANAAGDPSPGVPNKLYQTNITLDAGMTYTFSSDMWSEKANGSQLSVDLEGPTTAISVLSGYADAVPGVETVTASFTPAESGDFTLYLYTPATDNNHTWVDNISIVPEPSVATMLGMLGGLMFVRRRRK